MKVRGRGMFLASYLECVLSWRGTETFQVHCKQCFLFLTPYKQVLLNHAHGVSIDAAV